MYNEMFLLWDNLFELIYNLTIPLKPTQRGGSVLKIHHKNTSKWKTQYQIKERD